jgi:hypothetical protein
VRPKTMVKKVRGSHRSDLTTVRNCAIVRSVAIEPLRRNAQVVNNRTSK